MVFCEAVEDVIRHAGCQVSSLPYLPLEAAFVRAFYFKFEYCLVSFSLWMVVVKVLGQSVPNVFVFDVILVAFLDPISSRLAGLSVVDGLDVVCLTLRANGGVVGSTASVAAALEL